VTDFEGKRLFEAVQAALSRRPPQLDSAGVRRRVLEAHAASTRTRSRRGAYALALAGVVLVGAWAGVFAWRGPAPASFQIAGAPGHVGTWLQAQAAQPLSLSFSEGSRVSLTAGSRGRVTRLARGGARIELERGSVKAEVAHRADTDWTFSAGPFDVAVLGTQLDVSWSPEAREFELRVLHGAVRVRGPLIQDGQEVRAGQLCRVDLNRRVMELGQVTAAAATAEPPAAPATLPAAPEAATEVSEPGDVERNGSEPARPSWAALAQAGKHRDAVAAAERVGLPGIYRSATAEALLDLARAARQAGRPDLERATLLECRKRFAGQPAAAQAAYMLGRASPSAEAVNWFELYLREQPRGLLAREASGRVIESHLAMRNGSGAKRAASRYLAAYPDGPHASMARQALGSSQGN
jgi:TolA-binding protein